MDRLVALEHTVYRITGLPILQEYIHIERNSATRLNEQTRENIGCKAMGVVKRMDDLACH